MPIQIILNGQWKVFDGLDDGATILGLITAINVKPDRVAIEHNGAIASRKTWDETHIDNGDRIELVHFVGGGKS